MHAIYTNLGKLSINSLLHAHKFVGFGRNDSRLRVKATNKTQKVGGNDIACPTQWILRNEEN